MIQRHGRTTALYHALTKTPTRKQLESSKSNVLHLKIDQKLHNQWIVNVLARESTIFSSWKRERSIRFFRWQCCHSSAQSTTLNRTEKEKNEIFCVEIYSGVLYTSRIGWLVTPQDEKTHTEERLDSPCREGSDMKNEHSLGGQKMSKIICLWQRTSSDWLRILRGTQKGVAPAPRFKMIVLISRGRCAQHSNDCRFPHQWLVVEND